MSTHKFRIVFHVEDMDHDDRKLEDYVGDAVSGPILQTTVEVERLRGGHIIGEQVNAAAVTMGRAVTEKILRHLHIPPP